MKLNKILTIVIAIALLQSCECSNSSHMYPVYEPPYKPMSDEEFKELLKQNPYYKNKQKQSVQPQQKQSNIINNRYQKSNNWKQGYNAGWDDGYHDAVNGNDLWANYNASGNNEDYRYGYESGYIDGYENGEADANDNN